MLALRGHSASGAPSEFRNVLLTLRKSLDQSKWQEVALRPGVVLGAVVSAGALERVAITDEWTLVYIS